MRKQWTWLFLVIILAAGLMIGCDSNETITVEDEETLCGKVLFVKENMLVVEVGMVEEVFEFISDGEEKTIAIAANADITTMAGVKKTTATVMDVGVGDILAVTIKSGEAVTIVIHPQGQLEGIS